MLVNIHIPKTAGTTLRHALKTIYRNDHGVLQEWGQAQKYSSAELSKKKVWSGHVSYGLHRYSREGDRCNYVTFLRHPVERMLSHYYYILKQKNHVMHDVVSELTFREFCSGEVFSDCDNGMTRMLAGSLEVVYDPVVKPVVINDYRRALANLQCFCFVGLVELFEESLNAMAYYLKWDRVPRPDAKKVNYRRKVRMDDLDEDTFDLVLKAQAFDYALYQDAKKINKRLLEAQDVCMEREAKKVSE